MRILQRSEIMGFREFRNKYLGDGAFYRRLLTVALPIVVQNAITTFVSLLDNIMVGKTGTDPMTGVSIANQLIFVFNILVFGAISGAGIFTSQYHGSRDSDGVRFTMRFKLIICTVISVLGLFVFGFFRNGLISLYISDSAAVGDPVATLGYGSEYLKIIMLGLIPFAVTQCYAGTLRETDETVVPMLAGIAAVAVNLFFNWVLIFGKLGAPALGAAGAAIATVISRYVEMLIVVIWTHAHTEKNPFAKGLFRGLYIPKSVVFAIVRKGTPLLLNETLWSFGIAAVAQCYSVRGLEVVSANNISVTVMNLFNVVFLSLGNAIAIIVGQSLGAGKAEEAVDLDRKLLVVSVISSVVTGAVMAAAAPVFPQFYNTEPEIKHLATQMILAVAAGMPIQSFLNACYFTLRSGGKTFITFIFDSGAIWAINYPLVFVLTRFAPSMPVALIMLAEQLSGLIRCVLGYILVKKRIWVNNLTAARK